MKETCRLHFAKFMNSRELRATPIVLRCLNETKTVTNLHFQKSSNEFPVPELQSAFSPFVEFPEPDLTPPPPAS
jgi:hypothetical protein